ncbi:MAG TPA: hypothetical protein VGY48_26640 [Vicinamibacterales bacterium]|jgi:hypothetical protein|nr:hypothetical protein [Vicinamibacterales bacterium]
MANRQTTTLAVAVVVSLNEQQQQLKGLRGKTDFLSAANELARAWIQRE